jgi:hypothetical protein
VTGDDRADGGLIAGGGENGGPPTMLSDPTLAGDLELDWRRVPFEIAGLVDSAVLAGVEPGLLYRREGDWCIFATRAGVDVARVPVYRLRGVDRARLAAVMTERAGMLPAHEADQIHAAVNTDRVAVDAPPESDMVYIDVDGRPFCGCHRRLVVEGWPPDDGPPIR